MRHNGLILRTAPLATIDLGGDCLEQPLNLCIVQILERPRQIAWKRHRGRRGNPHSPNRRRQSPGRSRVLSLVFRHAVTCSTALSCQMFVKITISILRPSPYRVGINTHQRLPAFAEIPGKEHPHECVHGKGGDQQHGERIDRHQRRNHQDRYREPQSGRQRHLLIGFRAWPSACPSLAGNGKP